MKPSLHICIVNWNSGEQLRSCLASIPPALCDNFLLKEITIVDNSSVDNSINLVETTTFDLPISIVRSKSNLGFAKACNIASSAAITDYLLFLNPDTILRNDSLVRPISFMECTENNKIGILGIRLVDANDHIEESCAYFLNARRVVNASLGLNKVSSKLFPSHHVEAQKHLQSGVVDHVIGAFFLVRRNVFNELNGFDEDFFLYYEDLDFSYRAHKKGYKSYYLTSAQAYHAGGGCSKQVLARRLFYSLRSKRLYVKKHFNINERLLLFFVLNFIEPFTRSIFCIVQLNFKNLLNTLSAYWMLWAK